MSFTDKDDTLEQLFDLCQDRDMERNIRDVSARQVERLDDAIRLLLEGEGVSEATEVRVIE